MVEQMTPRKKSRVWRWVLGGSITLNFVFIGLLGGAALRFSGDGLGRGHDRPGPNMRGYAAPYVLALPKEARRAMGKKLRGGPEAKLMSRAERRAQFQQMVAIIRTVPFEARAAQQVLDAQAQATVGVQTAAQSLWLVQVTEMSEAGRAAYADRVEEVLARRGKRGKKNP